jgi:hypothetical protein
MTALIYAWLLRGGRLRLCHAIRRCGTQIKCKAKPLLQLDQSGRRCQNSAYDDF